MHPEIHIQEKLNQQLAQPTPRKPRNLWLDIAIYSVIIFIVLSLYLFATEGVYTLSSVSSAAANVGLLFIGLSFILSGLCYFWNFADHFIIYRKQLGVTGFVYALFHALIILYRRGTLNVLIPDSYTELSDIALITAEIAIVIYAAMIIISTKTVVHEIGGQRWRQLLRVGYIAVLLSLIHTYIHKASEWFYWLTGNQDTIFPALGLLVFIFGVGVIVMRIILWIVLLRKPSAPTNTPLSSPPPHL